MTSPPWLRDKQLFLGILLAHILLYFTFQDKALFWYTFTATMLILISYSIILEEICDQARFLSYLFYGTLSGLLLFFVFYIGNSLIHFLSLPFSKEISKLYATLSPTQMWHYIVLLLILIPGEEIFWRGFVQTRFQRLYNVKTGIILSSIFYATANAFSGSFILPLAALISGLFWGYLYAWKKSLPLVIVSHLIFDLFLLILYPLY